MSAPRTNAAIADELQEWYSLGDVFSPDADLNALQDLLGDALAALRKGVIYMYEIDEDGVQDACKAWDDARSLGRVRPKMRLAIKAYLACRDSRGDQPPALPAEVEAVLAKLLAVGRAEESNELLVGPEWSAHASSVCAEAATLLRSYAQAVAEKDAKLQAVEALCEVQSCETEPDRRYIADLVLAILREEH